MIYTSYFNSKLIRGKETKCVGVSRKHVKGFKYCSKLEPRKEMFSRYLKAKATGDPKIIKKAMKRYEIEYKRYLLTLDVHAAYQALDGRILLCFEADDSTCHRKWIRDWFKHFGYQVEELGAKKKETATETINVGTFASATKEIAKPIQKKKEGAKRLPTNHEIAMYMWQEFFVNCGRSDL